MKYVALLRGINVGGKNKVKMETLRKICGDIGFENVKTYINSGNVIFDARKTDNQKIAKKIEKAIEKEFSISINVMVRQMKEIENILGKNPFDGQFENDKDVHVLFLDEPMPTEKQELLISNNSENETFQVIGTEIYCHLRNGVLESILGKDYIGRKLKVSATGRNWRTVNRLAEFS